MKYIGCLFWTISKRGAGQEGCLGVSLSLMLDVGLLWLIRAAKILINKEEPAQQKKCIHELTKVREKQGRDLS